MLEWLKTILGDHYTEDIDKQISAEIGKGFVARADFNRPRMTRSRSCRRPQKNLTARM